MKRVLRLLLFLVILVGIFFSCRQYQTQILDFFDPPTARERYVRKFKNDTLRIQRWQRKFQDAAADSFQIPLPYAEHVRVEKDDFAAFTYDILGTEGCFTKIQLQSKDSTQSLFYHLIHTNKARPVDEGVATKAKTILLPDEPGSYKLIVQPSMETTESFAIHILKAPRYAFPVLGKGNAAVQSFWGASRDGGRRKHEGIDIFAKRGTPVVASVDGYVMRTGNRGLGGKQVWLKESILGNSLYYAHLDRILVSKGNKVQVGDTLGYVGNTGNAKHTPPHLHFGIYKNGYQTTDPLPFVKTYPSPKVDTDYRFWNRYRLSGLANLRNGPGTHFKKTNQLSQTQSIEILGKSEKWYRITSDTLRGFIHQSLIRPVENDMLVKN